MGIKNDTAHLSPEGGRMSGTAVAPAPGGLRTYFWLGSGEPKSVFTMFLPTRDLRRVSFWWVFHGLLVRRE